MARAVQILQYAGGLSFLLLTLGAWATARRKSQPQLLHLALGLGSLTVLAMFGWIDRVFERQFAFAPELSVFFFLSSGNWLLRFRGDFLPLSRRWRLAVTWSSLLAGAWVLIARMPRPPGEASPVQVAGILAIIGVWSVCLLEPVIRFWLASRRRPAVQRSRLRALSFSYAGILTIIVVSVFLGPAARHPAIRLALQLMGLLIVPCIFVSFAPPAWLRRAWRRREEDALLQATQELAAFAVDPASIARGALDRAIRLVGADGGFIADTNGAPLASSGIEPGQLEGLVANLRGGAAPEILRLDDRRHAVVAPLHPGGTGGSLVVVSGPFTPFFGSDEVARLGHFASTVGVALDRVRLSQALRAETMRYESLMDAVSDVGEGVVIAEDTRLAYANQAYLEICGYTFQELSAMDSLMDLAPEDERPVLLERYRKRRAGESVPAHYETALIHRDGHRVEVEVAVKILSSDDGVTRVISLIRDITERKLAAQATRRSGEALAEAQAVAHLGSWEWDVTAHSLQWSDELCRIFGVDPAGFVPEFENYIARVHPEDRDTVQAAIGRAMVEAAPFAFDHRIMRPGDGGGVEERTISCKGEVLTNDFGEPVRLFGTSQDVTESKATEDALRQAYEQERQAAERLRSVDSMKNSFLTAVSHELRTPLTAVLGFAKTLDQTEFAISPADRKVFLHRLSANAEKLSRLLSDLLDVDRLSRGLLEPVRRPVDVAGLARQVTADPALLQGRELHLRAQSVTVNVDAAKVERILENLISNAIRHTASETPIWARVEPFEDGVLIVVEDAGEGVAPELRESVFEPFKQGPDIPNHSPGVGIGLSLVFRFAELHGGRAWVEERHGGGASFRVYLPDVPVDLSTAVSVGAAVGGSATQAG